MMFAHFSVIWILVSKQWRKNGHCDSNSNNESILYTLYTQVKAFTLICPLISYREL